MGDTTHIRDLRGSLRALGALGLDRVAGLSRADLRALRAAGVAELRRGALDSAGALLDYACLVDPASAAAWDAAGLARLAAGRWQDAAHALEAAMALEPTWRRAVVLARCLAGAGDVTRAEAWADEARALVAGDPVDGARCAAALAAAEGGAPCPWAR
jgi:tetratricopeptide (TPR) repeat protein